MKDYSTRIINPMTEFNQSTNDIDYDVINNINQSSSINTRIIKNKHYSIKQVFLKTKDKITFSQKINDNLISFLFFIKGKAKIVYHNQSVEINNGEVFIQHFSKSTVQRSVSLEADEEFDVIHFLVKNDYIANLIEQYKWVDNGISLDRLFNDSQNNHQEANVLSFDYFAHSVLKEMMNVHLLQSNQLDYMNIKIKEIILLLHIQINKSKSKYDEEIEAVIRFLRNNYEKNYTIDQLATSFNISKSKLKNKFKEYTLTSIHDYFVAIKMDHAIELLKANLYINEIANKLGYASVSHFIKVFKKHYGYTPKEYCMIF